MRVIGGLVLIALIGGCRGYGTGAPTSVCDSMLPNHGIDSQDSEPPYALGISKAKEKDGDVVVVTIIAPEGDSFEGFFLQSRLASDKKQILQGRFTVPELTRTADCAGGKQNALTHMSTEKKQNLTSVWTPPPFFEGQVIFRSTVARTFDVFWPNIETVPIYVKGPTSATSQKEEALTPVLTTVSTTSMLDDYSVCGITKSCFGLPQNCIERRVCEVLLTYIKSNASIDFAMVAAFGDANPRWVGVGISEDDSMGGDSVTECLVQNDRVIVQQSWNTEPKKGNKVLSNPTLGINDNSGSMVDGVMTCKWKRPLVTNIQGVTFNLADNKYYLMLAKGVVRSNTKVQHTSRLASEHLVDFDKIMLISGKPNYLLKIHGSFMVVAWLGLVSISILLARHYKTVWEDRTLCKLKVWFACHRTLMLLAVAMMISAFVIIFIYVDGWSQVAPNPHPILGCVCTGLAVMQPIMAVFRPSPNAPKRYIFNWLHWFVGNAGQILAIVTMFFAVELSAVSLTDAFYWILISFVAFHCLVHTIMQIHTYHMEKKMTNEIQMQDLPTQKPGAPDYVKDAPGSGFRRFMLGIYIVVNAGIVTALVLIICLK